MTKLTIEITAEDDVSALRVLHRLDRMMDVVSGEDCGIHLSDAGYTCSHTDGGGAVQVQHVKDTYDQWLQRIQETP
jgi:hypothetical protein